MSGVLVDYENTIADADGSRWAARACGRMGVGNLWEGWIEFVPLDLERKPIRSPRESTQPSREDLLYWATGLTPVYLRGALTRALERPVARPRPRRVKPHFDGPAPSVAVPAPSPRVHPILDPFDVYTQGENILIGQRNAARASECDRHGRASKRDARVVRTYAPITASNTSVVALTTSAAPVSQSPVRAATAARIRNNGT